MLETKVESFEEALQGLTKNMKQIGIAAWIASLAIAGGNAEATGKLLAAIIKSLVSSAHALI